MENKCHTWIDIAELAELRETAAARGRLLNEMDQPTADLERLLANVVEVKDTASTDSE